MSTGKRLPGFQPGNTLAARSRLVEQAIRRAVTQDDGKRLRAGVERLLDLVAEGERWALEYLRDTMDGRPTQRIDADVRTSYSEVGVLAAAIMQNEVERDGVTVLPADDEGRE